MRQLKLYKLSVWKYGRKYFAVGYPSVRFIDRANGARLYTGAETKDVVRRFRKVKLRLTAEEVPAHAIPHQSALPLGDR